MGFSDGHPVLRWAARVRLVRLCLVIVVALLSGCGLIFDAVQLVWPIAKDEVDAICSRRQVRVGVAIEPFRPFVFPAIWTDQGPRVTGLDVELVQELTRKFSDYCGERPVTPVINLVRFHDLFIELSERNIDLFVSAVSANLPSPTRAGLAYSIPYISDAGLGAIAKDAGAGNAFRLLASESRASRSRASGNTIAVAVQDATAAHLYAVTHLTGVRLLVCDSLPAAFESQSPSPDVILGALPIVDFLVRTVHGDWHVITRDSGRPLLLTHEQYAIVLAEESYRLRQLVNDWLFDLERTGRLAAIRARWFDATYAYPRRAESEGLPFTVEQAAQHYDQGQCRQAEE